MTLWMRYKYRNSEGFGALEGETINVFKGDMFSGSSYTGQLIRLDDVEVLTPTIPKKMIAHIPKNPADQTLKYQRIEFVVYRR